MRTLAFLLLLAHAVAASPAAFALPVPNGGSLDFPPVAEGRPAPTPAPIVTPLPLLPVSRPVLASTPAPRSLALPLPVSPPGGMYDTRRKICLPATVAGKPTSFWKEMAGAFVAKRDASRVLVIRAIYLMAGVTLFGFLAIFASILLDAWRERRRRAFAEQHDFRLMQLDDEVRRVFPALEDSDLFWRTIEGDRVCYRRIGTTDMISLVVHRENGWSFVLLRTNDGLPVTSALDVEFREFYSVIQFFVKGKDT